MTKGGGGRCPPFTRLSHPPLSARPPRPATPPGPEATMPVHTLCRKKCGSPACDAIGALIAEHLVKDGATLQLGIGAIPDAVLTALLISGVKDLGVHSEMVSDGVVDLWGAGVITGARKVVHPGKITAGFAVGSTKLYDMLHDNPGVVMRDIAFVNATDVIARQPGMTAINSALEVDITGQVCADGLGTSVYSGVGGQMDFMRGAALAPGGVPIIALPSTTDRGESRICAMLHPGAGVVTTRAHVHYVVTEYGVAYLWGKSLQQRAQALIAIAHPAHRGALTLAAKERMLM